MKIKYIIFDLDGTLINTIPNHLRIFGQWAKEKFSIKEDEAANHYITTTGKPTSEQILTLLEKHQKPITQEESIELGKEIDSQLEYAEGSPYPEVPKVIEELKSLGYKIIIFSSQPTKGVGQILEKTGLVKHIDFFVGTNPDKPDFKKGEPYFRAAANHFNIAYKQFIQHAVFIGDGISDIEAAKNCSIKAIGRSGTQPEDNLRQAGADIVLKDLSALPDLLQTD